MTFNTALTGLRAATSDLNITGNNIANASTVGFKQSRAEFADGTRLAAGARRIGRVLARKAGQSVLIVLESYCLRYIFVLVYYCLFVEY